MQLLSIILNPLFLDLTHNPTYSSWIKEMREKEASALQEDVRLQPEEAQEVVANFFAPNQKNNSVLNPSNLFCLSY